jgi:hypothetical protein
MVIMVIAFLVTNPLNPILTAIIKALVFTGLVKWLMFKTLYQDYNQRVECTLY